MSLSATVDAMLAAGCSAEQIAAVVRAQEVQREIKVAERRAKDAERQRRHRESRNVTVTVADNADVTPEKRMSPTPPIEKTTPNNNPTDCLAPKPSKSEPSPRSILLEVLSAETTADLIEHRRKMRSAMTARAARELVKQFVAFGNPEHCAATMMARGWRGFNPDWMQNAGKPQLAFSATAPPLPQKSDDELRAIARQIDAQMAAEKAERSQNVGS